MPFAKMPDGREVDTASEDWRAFCEARWVLALPTLARRRAYLDAIAAQRGRAAADAMRAQMTVLHHGSSA